jgi:hypothetical protein
MPKFLNDKVKEDFDADPDESLLTSTAKRLAELGGSEPDDDIENDIEDDEIGDEDEDSDIKGLDYDDDKDDEDNDDEDGKGEDGEKDEDDDKLKDDEIEIPENYLSAAKHQGYTEEEVVELYQKDPEFAEKVFKKMYDATNFISQQASDFARQKRKQLQVAEDEKKAEDNKPKYKRVDIEKIKQKYGDDAPELIEMIEAQDNQLEQLFDVVQKAGVQKTTSRQASQEETVLLGKIQNFFDAEVEAGYDAHYGKAKRGQQWDRVLTGEQLQNRFAVVEEADAIFAGFELRGKPISYDEALERAHLVVSDKVREQAIRSSIGKKVKKRSKGITVKSTKMKTKRNLDSDDVAPKDPKKRESWLIKRTKKRMKKAFGSSDLS